MPSDANPKLVPHRRRISRDGPIARGRRLRGRRVVAAPVGQSGRRSPCRRSPPRARWRGVSLPVLHRDAGTHRARRRRGCGWKLERQWGVVRRRSDRDDHRGALDRCGGARRLALGSCRRPIGSAFARGRAARRPGTGWRGATGTRFVARILGASNGNHRFGGAYRPRAGAARCDPRRPADHTRCRRSRRGPYP